MINNNKNNVGFSCVYVERCNPNEARKALSKVEGLVTKDLEFIRNDNGVHTQIFISPEAAERKALQEVLSKRHTATSESSNPTQDVSGVRSAVLKKKREIEVATDRLISSVFKNEDNIYAGIVGDGKKYKTMIL